MQKFLKTAATITCAGLALSGCMRANNQLSDRDLAQVNTGYNLAKPSTKLATLYLLPLYSRTCLGDCPDYRGSYVFLKDAQGHLFYTNNDNIDCYYVKPGAYEIVTQNVNASGHSSKNIQLAAGQSNYYTIMNKANNTYGGAPITEISPEAANYYSGQLQNCSSKGQATCQVFNPEQGFTFQAQRWTIHNPAAATSLSAFNFVQCTVTYPDNTTQQCKYGFLRKTFLWGYAPTNNKCPTAIGQPVKTAECAFSKN